MTEETPRPPLVATVALILLTALICLGPLAWLLLGAPFWQFVVCELYWIALWFVVSAMGRGR